MMIFIQLLQELAHGLEELLAYEGDVEEDFGLTFQVVLYFELMYNFYPIFHVSHPGDDGKRRTKKNSSRIMQDRKKQDDNSRMIVI